MIQKMNLLSMTKADAPPTTTTAAMIIAITFVSIDIGMRFSGAHITFFNNIYTKRIIYNGLTNQRTTQK